MEEPRACLDGIDNDGDGLTDVDAPGCHNGSGNPTFTFFEMAPIPIVSGELTGFACELSALDCEAEADFSVTSAVIVGGEIGAPSGMDRYSVSLFVPEIALEGQFGDVARVEIRDSMPSGLWWAPFGTQFLGLPFIFYHLNFDSVTVEEFDAAGSSLSGPTTVSFSLFEGWTNAISFCQVGAGGLSGRCEIHLDTFNAQSSLDIGGVPHRLVWKLAPLDLVTVPEPGALWQLAPGIGLLTLLARFRRTRRGRFTPPL